MRTHVFWAVPPVPQIMPLSLQFAAQQCGGRTSLVGTGGPAYRRRRRAAAVAVLCTTAAVIALMRALPGPLAAATAYQTTGLPRVDAASGVMAAAEWRGRPQHRKRPARRVRPHRLNRSGVQNGPTEGHGRPLLSGAGDGSARGGSAQPPTGLLVHWLALLLAAAATAVVGLRRPRCLWSLAAVSSASDWDPAGPGLDRDSGQRTKSGRAPAALVAQVEQLQQGETDRRLDDLTGRLWSQMQGNGDRELDEEMCAAARHLEAVIGIGPDELRVLHRNASDLPSSDDLPHFCGLLGSASDDSMGAEDKAWAPARKRLLAWNRVRSESDLFLPGFEKFDAKQVYHDELLARRKCLDSEAHFAKGLCEERVQLWAAARWHIVGWVCSPAELQARAYFPALRDKMDKLLKVAEILEQPEDNVVRMHVLQNCDWWNSVLNDHFVVLNRLEDILGNSLTRVRGIGDQFAGRLARAGVADLRALARLDEGQQQALVPKLVVISAKRLQKFVTEAQQLVEEPPATCSSLTQVHGIGDPLAGRLARAGVADLRALARLDEGQQQALTRKLPGAGLWNLQGFVEQARVLVEMPPLALDAGAELQSSTLQNRQREIDSLDVQADDTVVGDRMRLHAICRQ